MGGQGGQWPPNNSEGGPGPPNISPIAIHSNLVVIDPESFCYSASIAHTLAESYMLWDSPNIINNFFYSQVLMHRLQLSRNLRDSPGFVDFVPCPGGPSYLSRKVTD